MILRKGKTPGRGTKSKRYEGKGKGKEPNKRPVIFEELEAEEAIPDRDLAMEDAPRPARQQGQLQTFKKRGSKARSVSQYSTYRGDVASYPIKGSRNAIGVQLFDAAARAAATAAQQYVMQRNAHQQDENVPRPNIAAITAEEKKRVFGTSKGGRGADPRAAAYKLAMTKVIGLKREASALKSIARSFRRKYLTIEQRADRREKARARRAAM